MSSNKESTLIGISSSKAVQCFRPKNGQASTVKKNEEKTWKQKDRAYKETLSYFEEKFIEIQKVANLALRNSLKEFVKTKEHPVVQSKCIHTAIVNLGFSIGDHEMFSDFVKQDLKTGTRLCRLNSTKHKNAADVINSIFDAVFDHKLRKRLGLKTSSKPTMTYSTIAALQEKFVDAKGPLIVLIEDLECFDCSILNRLIPVIGDNLQNLPVFFIFLVSVTCASLQNLFDSKAICRLVIHNFDSKPAKNCFDDLVNESLILSDNHFRFGPQVISFLIETFLYYDFSLLKIWLILKFCIFQHFFTNPYAKYCYPANVLNEMPLNITEKDLQCLQKLPSLKNCTLPSNVNQWKKFIITKASNLEEYHTEFVKSLFSFYTLNLLLKKPFGNHFRDLYLAASEEQKLVDRLEYKETIGMLRLMSSEEWEDRLAAVLSEASSPLSRELAKHYKTLKDVTLDTNLEDSKAEKPKLSIGNVKNLTELQKKIKESMVISKKKPSKFELWKNEVLDAIHQYLKSLISPTKLPLSEVFFYNDIDKVKAHWLTSPRTQVVNALRKPELILNLKNNKPDVCTLFNVYDASLTSINTKEWLNMFKNELSLDPKYSCSPSKRKKVSSDVLEKEHIRQFFTCLGDLEQMGFIQAAARKKGDVQTKLVW